MQDAVFDFLRAALVPELRSNVAAGAAGDVQLVLVAVAAIRAFPYELAIVLDDLDLAVVAAFLAVVGLGVQLGVHDVVIDVLHHAQDCLQVVLHVGNFDVADGAAGGQALELAFEVQLLEGVDFLGNMHVVAVGDVTLVGDVLDHAETTLQGLGELVRGGFQRRAVQGVVDVLGFLPLGALVVEMLHDLKGERGGFGVGVAVTGHVFDALVQARIAKRDGGVAAVEQLVDGFALLQAGKGAVLPKDGRRIGKRALQALVAATQGAMAKLEAFVEDLPELIHVAVRGQSDVGQVDGYHALVEATVVLRLARLVVAGVGHVVIAVAGTVGGKERTATHAGVHIAVALGFALGQFVLAHLLLGDVVGNHALRGALRSHLGEIEVRRILGDVVLFKHVDELRERRRDPNARLVLDALVALTEHLLDDHGQVVLLGLVLRFVQVHEDGDERSLAVGGHEGDDLILDDLDAAADLVAQTLLDNLVDLLAGGLESEAVHFGKGLSADLLARDVDERGQMGERDGLAAVLAGSHLCDDLRGDVARGGEAVRLLDERARDDGAVLQHVFKVHQVAVVHVLGEVVGIMEMDEAVVMGFDDVMRQKLAHGEVFRNLAGHVVALNRNHGGVLVGVFLLHFFVVGFDKRKNFVVGRVLVALLVLQVAIDDVLARDGELVQAHDLVFDKVLDLFDRDGVAGAFAGIRDVGGSVLDLALGETLGFGDLLVRLADGVGDLGDVEQSFGAVALDDLHIPAFLLTALSKACLNDVEG